MIYPYNHNPNFKKRWQKTMHKQTPDWLDDAVIYNIYPQSFYDSNADGVGDLEGIIQKLDYIESLGVNCIWLNPIYVSPFGDAGYDVADFRRVAPRYGTNEDAARLFEQADKRGIRVLLDFVAGHTSVEHPWFQESAKPEDNRYSNWYVWTGSAFGPCGEGDYVGGYSDRDGRFMSNFFYFQPALNYGWPEPQYDWQLPTDHPDVMAMKAEMRDIMRFWLDMGASGFRVDMAASLVKGDPDNSATMEYWEGVRKWMDEEYPGAVIISEWSCPKQAIHCGFHIDFMIHSGTEVYTSLFRKEDGRNVFPGEGNSFFDRRGRGDIREFLDVYLDHYQATKDNGYISIPSGNHDLPRLNCGRSEKELRVAFAFVLTMPGVPTIYYGDEIGMRHITGLTSKEGGYVRTGARTPMQWDKTENAGFSRARPKELYLPIDREPDRPTVAEQEGEADSLLQLVRRLVRLRRNNEALKAYGRFIELYAEAGGYPFVYARFSGAQTVIVGVNPADREQTCFVSKAKIDRMPETLIEGAGGIVEEDDGWTFNMPPISFAIWG